MTGKLVPISDTYRQALTLTGNILTIGGATSPIDLSKYLDNTDTDEQNLGLGTKSGTQQPITIDNGTGITIDVADNDNLPENELQTISLNGSTLSISDRNSVELDSLQDADWYDAQTTNVPTDINNNIYTLGRVGIGTDNPAKQLDVDNGTVRFSDYGIGVELDNTKGNAHPHSAYHLGVMDNGDVVEVNTAKSAKIFYPPSVVIDVSTTGTNRTIDLYQEYVDRFASPALSSTGPSGTIPTYARTEIEFHVTDYDDAVFSNVGLNAAGVFSFDVVAVPSSNCTYVNVVFVVK